MGKVYGKTYFSVYRRLRVDKSEAQKGNGYRNAVNSARLFSRLNPYCISVDSLTLFPDTEPFAMAACGEFIPAGEKERMEELKAFIENLQIRTHLFANSASNFYPFTAFFA